MNADTARVRRRVALTLLVLPVSLLIGEIASRVWVAVKYSRERIEQLTTHTAVRGRFASHPYLPYVLNAAFEGHNALGFRGPAFEAAKQPGVQRIACLGASTTYGSLVDPADSYPAQLGRLLENESVRFEVVNAGVPGWVSTELLIDLELRVLPLQPDIVVILPGRNEVFPQTYNSFRPDYTHFRRAGFNFTVSNFVHKEIFRWSRFAMLACTVRGERFGWSETEEHPLYGGISWGNRPTPEEAMRNAVDPSRMITFRRSLEQMIELCRARGIRVMMGTMQFRPELFTTIELGSDPRLQARLGELIDADNELIRQVARGFDVPVAETAQVSARPEWFLDDSHLTGEGHRQQARIVREALAPWLRGP